MNSRDKIKSKIAALKAKTKAAGCTEAEAMAAAELAAKLMQAHGLSEAEIEFVSARMRAPLDMAIWQKRLIQSICASTNTAVIVVTDDICEIEFSGKKHSVEIAMYLRDVLTRSVNAEIRKLRSSAPYRRLRKASSKSTMTNSFAFGMINRIERKLSELFRSTISQNERAVARKCLDEKYPDAETKWHRPVNTGNHSAYFSGAKAGDALQLSHGVSGRSGTQALIGRA